MRHLAGLVPAVNRNAVHDAPGLELHQFLPTDWAAVPAVFLHPHGLFTST